MKSIFVVFLCIAIILLLVPGCDKGPVATQRQPEKASERVAQANQILFGKVAQIANSNGTDSTAFNTSGAVSLYREALQFDNSNLDAHFGLAVSEIIGLFSDTQVTSVIGPSVVGLSPASWAFSRKPQGAALLDRIRSAVTSEGIKGWRPGSGLVKSDMLNIAQPPSYYQDLIEARILPVFEDAIIHLQAVTANRNYAFLITPAMTGGAITETYRVDLTEIYLLLSILQGITAETSFFVSYNIDYNAASPTAIVQTWEQSSPFLALRGNGALRMRNTRGNLIGMANSIKSGIDYFRNEPPHTEIDIIQYRPQDDPALLQVSAGMDQLIMYLSTDIPVADGTSINLQNFFESPVQNWKQKLPSYAVTAQPDGLGGYEAVLTWEAASFDAWIFPDPTFNGFLPGMTDIQLKALIGVTALTWTQSVVIGN